MSTIFFQAILHNSNYDFDIILNNAYQKNYKCPYLFLEAKFKFQVSMCSMCFTNLYSPHMSKIIQMRQTIQTMGDFRIWTVFKIFDSQKLNGWTI